MTATTETRITLQKCRLRETRLVATGDPLETLTWPEVVERFVPDRRDKATAREHALIVRKTLRVGTYAGLLLQAPVEEGQNPEESSAPAVFFGAVPRAGSADIGWLIQRDETVPRRIACIYRVVETVWAASVTDLTPDRPDPELARR